MQEEEAKKHKQEYLSLQPFRQQEIVVFARANLSFLDQRNLCSDVAPRLSESARLHSIMKVGNFSVSYRSRYEYLPERRDPWTRMPCASRYRAELKTDRIFIFTS